MPPRRNHAADTAERQQAFRSRKAEQGLTRHEMYLDAQAIEDEAFIRSRLGPERVRVLVAWVLRKERLAIDPQSRQG